MLLRFWFLLCLKIFVLALAVDLLCPIFAPPEIASIADAIFASLARALAFGAALSLLYVWMNQGVVECPMCFGNGTFEVRDREDGLQVGVQCGNCGYARIDNLYRLDSDIRFDAGVETNESDGEEPMQ